MKKVFSYSMALCLLAAWNSAAAAEEQSSAIQKKLESEYRLTKTSDDKSSIVTAGSVVILHKDKVTMVPVTAGVNPCMNTYKNGKISAGKCGVAGTMINPLRSHIPFGDKMPPTRAFVTGEKFWVTKIDIQPNRIVFVFFTDAVSDVHYQGNLTIPFESSNLTPDEALKLVSEVITAAPSDDDKGAEGVDNGTKPAVADTEATPAALVAPPPPTADPVEVKEGQTTEEVEKALGQPLKKITVGPKQIYDYKDVKVTFVDGRVKDVQ
jgi:hypothetical protein